MKYCPKCRGEIGDYAVECSHCGYNLLSDDNSQGKWNGGYGAGGYNTDGYETGGYNTDGYETGGYNTYGYEAGGYNYKNYNTVNKTKKANKAAFIIGVVFLLAAGAVIFLVVNKLGRYKDEKAVIQEWMDAMISGDARSFVDDTFCKPFYEAFLKEFDISESDYMSSLSGELSEFSNIKIKNIKIKSKTPKDSSYVDSFNEFIEYHTGITDAITAAYNLEVEYMFKEGSYDWEKVSEEISMYVYRNRYYMDPNVIG